MTFFYIYYLLVQSFFIGFGISMMAVNLFIRFGKDRFKNQAESLARLACQIILFAVVVYALVFIATSLFYYESMLEANRRSNGHYYGMLMLQFFAYPIITFPLSFKKVRHSNVLRTVIGIALTIAALFISGGLIGLLETSHNDFNNENSVYYLLGIGFRVILFAAVVGGVHVLRKRSRQDSTKT